MKAESMDNLRNLRRALTLMGLPLALATAQTVPGLPEPGMILYGSILNTRNNQPLASGNINMQVTGGGDSLTLNGTFVSVNGQSFYLVRVPLETRSIPGLTVAKTPNTLALVVGGNYTRSVTVNGTPATMVSSSRNSLASFTLNPSDRGVVERLNLEVAINPPPGDDTDGDGALDGAEVIAGTDPQDPKSVFKLSTDIKPTLQGGLTLTWSSVPGKNYIVSRSTNLTQGFTASSPLISATGSNTSYTDSSVVGNGPYFYRIQIVP